MYGNRCVLSASEDGAGGGGAYISGRRGQRSMNNWF